LDKKELQELVQKFKSNRISDAELRTLKQYLSRRDSEDLLDEIARDSANQDAPARSSAVKDEMFAEIWQEIDHLDSTIPTKRRIPLLTVLSGCAAALLLLFGTYWLYQSKHFDFQNENTVSLQKLPIAPGGSKAELLLADGSTINLESLANDTSIQLAGYSVHKNKSGELSYVLDKSENSQEIRYNTIITPRGGEYKLTLADGTKIWVNASSKVRYPINFDKNERTVELEGEAYFQVAKQMRNGKRIPFSVHTKEQKLEVLGTSFNINAYDKQISTTLVEGKVKLSYPEKKDVILAPNEQARYSTDKKKLTVSTVEPYYEIAWKEGAFAFQNTPIAQVLETLGRWYAIDVSFNKDVKDLKFTGTLSKYEQIEKILQVIELTEAVKFKIEGRRVFVM